jgi:hypothetical protein
MEDAREDQTAEPCADDGDHVCSELNTGGGAALHVT